MKALKYIAVGLGTFFTGRYLLSLGRANKKIVISVSGEKGQISTQGIEILLKYNIKNPSRANLKITPPLIKLLVNEKLVASSSMQSVDIPQQVKDSQGRIQINAYKETGVISTSVLVPWISLLQISPDLMTRLKQASNSDTSKVSISVETLSQAFTPLGDFPVDDKSTVQL